MADPRGFLNIESLKPTSRPVHQRIKVFGELYHPTPPQSVRAQASRCMDCGVPFCHSGCPLVNLIRDWCHRQRTRSVLPFDDNPRPPENDSPETPSPLWPKIRRDSPAHEEGGLCDWRIKTQQLLGDEQGRVNELHAVPVRQDFDEAGDRQVDEVHAGELAFPRELVLLAIGSSGPERSLPESLGLAMGESGALRSDRNSMTSQPGIFAAGDCRRGQSIVVWALAEGREAARHIDMYLKGRPSRLRARDHSPLEIMTTRQGSG